MKTLSLGAVLDSWDQYAPKISAWLIHGALPHKHSGNSISPDIHLFKHIVTREHKCQTVLKLRSSLQYELAFYPLVSEPNNLDALIPVQVAPDGSMTPWGYYLLPLWYDAQVWLLRKLADTDPTVLDWVQMNHIDDAASATPSNLPDMTTGAPRPRSCIRLVDDLGNRAKSMAYLAYTEEDKRRNRADRYEQYLRSKASGQYLTHIGRLCIPETYDREVLFDAAMRYFREVATKADSLRLHSKICSTILLSHRSNLAGYRMTLMEAKTGKVLGYHIFFFSGESLIFGERIFLTENTQQVHKDMMFFSIVNLALDSGSVSSMCY